MVLSSLMHSPCAMFTPVRSLCGVCGAGKAATHFDGLFRPEHIHIDTKIPYELLALEAALDACCKNLDKEVADLESSTVPVLNK